MTTRYIVTIYRASGKAIDVGQGGFDVRLDLAQCAQLELWARDAAGAVALAELTWEQCPWQTYAALSSERRDP